VDNTLGLSVVVVNWNTRDLLAGCLESLAGDPGLAIVGEDSSLADRSFASTEHHPLVTEVWVVDNASTDGSPQMVRERFSWVRLIENSENVGFAAASNQGIRQATGRYVLLLNSDAVLAPGSPVRLLAFADHHPRAGIVGVQLVNPDGSFQAALNDFPSLGFVLLEAWALARWFSGNTYYPSYPPERSRDAVPCDWVGGACLLARAAAIEQVGLLDEYFFMYSEEMDWCYRMWESGWEVWYTPDVKVIHLGAGSADRLSAVQRLRLYTSKARFIEKRSGSFAARVVRLNYRVSSLLKALGYQFLFLVVRDHASRQCAQSHWQVALQRTWS
jgi:N-acetylglucosaminyl-diphospho-decaprenol L-rhamnosyltransferase